MIRLAIGIPAYGGKVVSYQTLMWSQIGAALVQRKEAIEPCMFGIVDTCGIENARNTLIESARVSKADWLLMIDADTWVSKADDLLRMIIEADSSHATVVGAPVLIRGEGRELNVKSYDRSADKYRSGLVTTAEDREEYIVPSWNSMKQGLIQVDAIGAAVMALNIPNVGDLRFRFTPTRSEDLDMCHRLKQLPPHHIVMADYRVKTHHLNKPDILTFEGER